MASEMKTALDALQASMATALEGVKARIAALETQGQRTDMTAEEETQHKADVAAFAAQIEALANPPVNPTT